jgi:sugar O-acyltransferase (sialic acid O-acetyltransferase NeuD family)
MSESVYLIGAGGHGAVIKEIIELNDLKISFFIDQNSNIQDCLGVKVIQDENKLIENQACIVSIGDNATRKRIVSQHVRGYINAVHPNSVISPSVTIGIGNVFMAGACINARTTIGDHCIINTNCSVDHDCKIEDFAHISPGASLGGNVHVGEGAHIGIGASVKQGVIIGKWSFVGAGAAVISDVPDGVVVVGVPAKFLKSVDFNYE